MVAVVLLYGVWLLVLGELLSAGLLCVLGILLTQTL